MGVPATKTFGTIQVPITASDSTDLADAGIKYVVCLTAGNCVVRGKEGTNVTYPMTAMQILPFQPSRIMAASTGTYVGIK